MRAETITRWLLRLVALALIGFALMYWARLTGFQPGPNHRFDTMTQHWRLASLLLAVALPIAALGLWSGASWGVVLWVPVAAMELAMYGWLTPLYGTSDYRVAFHLATLCLFGALVLWSRYRPGEANDPNS